MTVSVSFKHAGRVATPALAASMSALLLAGCVAGPTYGTGKGSNEQLLEDVTGILSVGPKDKPQIDYKPRPDLVRPANVRNAQLPAPQDNVTVASNGAWPESPEQRLARVRAEATATRDNPDFSPEVSPGMAAAGSQPIGRRTRGDDLDSNGNAMNPDAQRTEFKRRLAVSQQGSATTRRYLSEPPLAYRAPAETAASDQLGEDEWKKERDAKRAARKNKKRSWADILPW